MQTLSSEWICVPKPLCKHLRQFAGIIRVSVIGFYAVWSYDLNDATNTLRWTADESCQVMNWRMKDHRNLKCSVNIPVNINISQCHVRVEDSLQNSVTKSVITDKLLLIFIFPDFLLFGNVIVLCSCKKLHLQWQVGTSLHNA